MNTHAASPARTLAQEFAHLAQGGLVRRLLELARDEDLGSGPHAGDITSIAWGEAQHPISARVVPRGPLVVAGIAAMPTLLELFAPGAQCEVQVHDGTRSNAGETLATLRGPASQVLALERTLLNLLSRLSGIATLTSWYVEEARAANPGVLICDTRKTTPGLRVLEKYAVRCGGGHSHRMGLHDAVLIKDNHLAMCHSPQDAANRVVEASRRARADRPLLFVEVEADSLEQVDLFLALPRGTIDLILLDNMPVDSLREAVRRRDAAASAVRLEASGGVNIRTIGAIAATGVERISVGAITHSAQSIDLGLDVP